MDRRVLMIIGLLGVTILIGMMIVFFKGKQKVEAPKKVTAVQTAPTALAPPPPPPPPPKILVAARDVPAHVILTEDDLQEKVMPKPWTLPYVESKDKSKLVRRITRQALEKGQPILDEYLFKGQKFSYVIPKGLRAVPIPVDEQAAVLYMIKPGDLVDALCIFPEKYTDQIMTKILIQRARVLSVGTQYIPDYVFPSAPQPQKKEKSKKKKKRKTPKSQAQTTSTYQFVVLGVKPHEAEKLVLAEQIGKLRLLLRGEGSEELAYTTGGYKSTILSKNYRENYLKIESLDRLKDVVEIYKGTELIHNVQVNEGFPRVLPGERRRSTIPDISDHTTLPSDREESEWSSYKRKVERKVREYQMNR